MDMNPWERRQKILEILCLRRHETIGNLAHEFNVSRGTIRRDIVVLTCSYPIETVQGGHGGIRVAEWFHLDRRSLNSAEIIDRTPSTVAQSLRELEDVGLVEKKLIALHTPYHIYIKLPAGESEP